MSIEKSFNHCIMNLWILKSLVNVVLRTDIKRRMSYTPDIELSTINFKHFPQLLSCH